MTILQMVTHCPVDGWHLGCSLFGAIMNKAAMGHSHICTLMHKGISRNGIAGCKVCICLASIDYFKQFSDMVAPTYTPTNGV